MSIKNNIYLNKNKNAMKYGIKRYFFLIACIWLSCITAPLFVDASMPANYVEQYGVNIVKSPDIDTAYPTWAQVNPEQDKTDLEYRAHEVLPFGPETDMYLVYPKYGVVTQVNEPSSSDKALIAQNKKFNHFPYLTKGALFYYGTSPDQWKGNMVIAAHTARKKSEKNNYATIFQPLLISQPGDYIFVYIKNQQGTYDFYKYVIKKSYETTPDDISVLKQTNNKYLLTTYGCSDIWTTDMRRINRAELEKKYANHSDLRHHTSAPLLAQTTSYQKSVKKMSNISKKSEKEATFHTIQATEKKTSPVWGKVSSLDTQVSIHQQIFYRQNIQATPIKLPETKGETTVLERKIDISTRISPIMKLRYQRRMNKLSSFVISKLKFNIQFVKAFIQQIDKRIEVLQNRENTSTDKIYMLQHLKEKLEMYVQ